MRLPRAFLVVTVVLMLSAAAVGLTACSGGPPTGPVSPGVKSGALGGMEVVGYLGRSEVRDGTWNVFDVKPGPSSSIQPAVIAVLRPGSVDENGIAALDGRYIWASGRAWSGRSGAVPEIQVDGIDIATAP